MTLLTTLKNAYATVSNIHRIVEARGISNDFREFLAMDQVFLEEYMGGDRDISTEGLLNNLFGKKKQVGAGHGTPEQHVPIIPVVDTHLRAVSSITDDLDFGSPFKGPMTAMTAVACFGYIETVFQAIVDEFTSDIDTLFSDNSASTGDKVRRLIASKLNKTPKTVTCKYVKDRIVVKVNKIGNTTQDESGWNDSGVLKDLATAAKSLGKMYVTDIMPTVYATTNAIGLIDYDMQSDPESYYLKNKSELESLEAVDMAFTSLNDAVITLCADIQTCIDRSLV